MSLILYIHTATEKAWVSIAKDSRVFKSLYHESVKDHASFLQPAIQLLLKETSLALNEFDAIAITAGPGSYTGLRVGMASAKGLCYALQKPLILLNTLEVLAASAIYANSNTPSVGNTLFCPMIDARRMEVYYALYDSQLRVVKQPAAFILTESSFIDLLQHNHVFFFGNGSRKWQNICRSDNADFREIEISPEAMAHLGEREFLKGTFADFAHCDPIYLKEFHTFSKK